MSFFRPESGLEDYDMRNDFEALRELSRERDAAEVQTAIFAFWPVQVQLEYLRDAAQERIRETERMLTRTYRILDAAGLGRKGGTQ